MYTIKQASARTGLTIPTIRVWERRYGVVQPKRTPAGYRLYDDAAIDRLLAMHHLVEGEGWRPSQAAERVNATGDDELRAMLPPGGIATPSGVPGAMDPSPHARDDLSSDAAVTSYLTAARGFDVPAMERVLDDAFASRRFERAMDEIVFPALREIGRAWAEDALDVAQEHVASETIRRRLARFFDVTGHGGWTAPIIVGMAPGGQHELGALSFAVAGRRAGLDILYLGPNVPVASWLRTVRETEARTVALAVVTRGDAASATRVVTALLELARPPMILLGGAAAGDVTDAPGVVRLPEGMDRAVAATVALVADERPGD